MTRYRLIHQNANIEAPDGAFDIGRSIDCYLVLDDPSVSRVHATMYLENGKLSVEDRGSRNGIQVNGTQASGRTQLRDGDRVGIGHQTIRVVAVGRTSGADKTLGLKACDNCGAWVAATDEACSKCGNTRETTGRIGPRSTVELDTAARQLLRQTQRPQAMVAALVQKAISMSKFAEAERLLTNLMESAVKRRDGGANISGDELTAISNAAVELAEASGAPKSISRLFAFQHSMGQLLARETVESLYKVVRKASYRTCPDFTAYLAFLSSRSATFTPGDKFVYRRLEGLVGMCS